MAPGEQQRERLELSDFEVPEGESFDAVNWLNARLARNGGVPMERLDQHLSLLGMSCQLLCQDTSESIEVACNQLVGQMPGASRDVERVQQEVLAGRERLSHVVDGLKDADDRKKSGLHGLAEIDAVKTRVETACSALREVGSWERRVRDCDQLIGTGGLPTALTQLVSLREVLQAFRMLPEYGKKDGQLKQLEDKLLSAARRKARSALERNDVNELRDCCDVLNGMDKPGEPLALSNALFEELAQKAWKDAQVKSDATAGELGSAFKGVFDVFIQAFDDRRELLKLLDSIIGASETEKSCSSNAVVVHKAGTASVSAGRAALVAFGANAEQLLKSSGSEAGAASEHERSARTLAILAAYVDSFEAFANSASIQESPELMTAICRDDDFSDGQVLPWVMLTEVVSLAILGPMQDDALALVPSCGGSTRPSEAVLAAESGAKKLMRMAPQWAQRLEQQGINRLAVPWLACIDVTCASYWRQWNQLFETFRNTFEQKSVSAEGASPGAGEGAYDAALLNEALQLHSLLHDAIPAAFGSLRGEALQLAVRLAGCVDPPFSRALAAKLQDPSRWCKSLGAPAAASLEAACCAVLGSTALPARSDGGGEAAGGGGTLPAAAAALASAERAARDVVTRCCVRPVEGILAGYPEEPHWSANPEGGADGTMPTASLGLLPLSRATAVGEHLFSLVPQLERSQDGSQFEWLAAVLEAVVECVLQHVLQIKKLTFRGAEQLTVDLDYIQKVTSALGTANDDGGPTSEDNSGGAAGGATRNALGEYKEVLAFLLAQLRRKLECQARGEVFAEAPREPAAVARGRRFERPLRAALGLAGAQAAQAAPAAAAPAQ